MLCAHFHFSYSVFCLVPSLSPSFCLLLCWFRLCRCCASFFCACVLGRCAVRCCAVWLQLIFTSSIFARLTCSRETCFVFLIHSYIECEWYFSRSLVKSYTKNTSSNTFLLLLPLLLMPSNWFFRWLVGWFVCFVFIVFCWCAVDVIVIYSVIEQCLYTLLHCTES